MELAHNIRDTSREAYREVKGKGVDTIQHKQILDYLRMVGRPLTRRQISQATGIENSTVAARVNTLIKDLGVLYEPYKDKCPISGINVNYVALVKSGHQSSFNF